jgi:hypothetical protein
MSAQLDEILSGLATLNTSVDKLIAQGTPTPEDLSPIKNAIGEIQAKVDAATTPPTIPAT